MPLPSVHSVATPVGRIAVREACSAAAAVPLLLVHGNSLSSRSFRALFEHAWTARRRLVAIDLPGHGESDWAEDPDRTYTVAGWARALAAIVDALALSDVVLLGHSLGGHVALEASPRIRGLRGLVLVGMAPVFPGFDIARVFHPAPAVGTAFEANPDAAAVDELLELFFGGPDLPGEAREDFVRADPCARPRLLASTLAGETSDERRLVVDSPVPIALVLGGEDGLVRDDGIDSLTTAALWRSGVQRIPAASHTPWLQDADRFVDLVEAYLADVRS